MNHGIAGFGFKAYMLQPLKSDSMSSVSRKSRRSITPKRTIRRRSLSRSSNS